MMEWFNANIFVENSMDFVAVDCHTFEDDVVVAGKIEKKKKIIIYKWSLFQMIFA